jgi:predicted RNA binding protein YcfA (HicA-like mRNA interferase family)
MRGKIMTSKKNITFTELERLLKKLGFVDVQTTGPQVVFEYPEYNFHIVLPTHEKATDLVPMRHIVGIRGQLDDLGLMSREAFEGLTEKVPS